MPTARLKVALVSPEAVPFAKTGGLGDMVGSLALALSRHDVEVSLVLPAYRHVLARPPIPLSPAGDRFEVRIGDTPVGAEVLTGTLHDRIPVQAIRADRYFDREHLYGPPNADYADNPDRFALFARAALEVLSMSRPPDVIHCHDWQTGLLPAFLRLRPDRYPRLASTRTMLTVHNVGYQGLADAGVFGRLDVGADAWPRFEFYGRVNYLKAGVSFADLVTTVSPTYAREIQTAEQGCGLEGVFRERAGDLVGLLNGVDYDVWNPAADPLIAHPFSPDDLAGKRVCKTALQRLMRLPATDEPVVGMVTRLVDQKGCDLVAASFDRLMARGVQLVLLGTGDPRYERLFADYARQYPGQAAVRLRFDEAVAHAIEAGSDLFLMPSRYEPSGLNQLYSMKYGTIPVVRATGGLKDSVVPFDPATGVGTGVVFEPDTAAALLEAVDTALDLYRRPQAWAAVVRNAMTADFSVDRVAAAYVDVYTALRARKP